MKTTISNVLDKAFPIRVKRRGVRQEIEKTKEGMARIEELMKRLDEPHKNGMAHAMMYMAAKDKLERLQRQLEWL